MIVGTAGHIDHGKTALVHALTGVDTDRLKEEKARGISIELGYAYVPVRAARPGCDPVLGFVDVPGHERLVHTMVAGAGGIDFALLVIAADDGVMPQTREHLAILDLLGVGDGAVALTKVDRVDAARAAQVQAQVRALLAPTGLRDAPLFTVDATAPGDAGVEALREHLHAAAAARSRRAGDGLFRLAVDRVFTLAGHGTIVTGTVHAGCAGIGDRLVVMPGGAAVRVRGIHAQNRVSETAGAGQRCALNLAGIDKDGLARGDWVADPRAFLPSLRLDVRLRLLADAPALGRPWTPLHVHLGTAHRLAHAVLLDVERLPAGGEGRVQLVFDTPVCATPGDGLIVRDAQATSTIGGGTVLDPQAPERRRRSAARLGWLAAVERFLENGGVAPLLEQAPHGIARDVLMRLCGRESARIATPDTACRIETAGGVVFFHAAHWQALRQQALAVLVQFHSMNPDDPGIDSGQLRRRVAPALDDATWRSLVASLVADRLVQRNGHWLHLPDHRIGLDAGEQALMHRLQPLIRAGGFDPPWVRELAAAVDVAEDRVRSTLHKSVTGGEVCQVVRDLFYAADRIDELAAILRELAERDGAVDVARYRDALGLGRKRTVQILEFFDRVGYTRRVRDTHVVRSDSGWHGRG